MKEFIFAHPSLTGFILFLLIIIGGPTAGIVIESRYYKPEPGCVDNCEGILILLSIMASLVLSILAGLTTALIIQKAKRQD